MSVLFVTTLALTTIFMAALIKAVLGFGESLIAMPLLTLSLGIRVASPLICLVATSLTALVLCTTWQKVDLRATWRFALAAAVGTPLGVWGLRSLPATLATGILGGVLVLAGMYYLARPNLGAVEGAGWAYGFGLIAGILSGAYNVAGPPAVLYGSLKRWAPERFRATLQGFFLPITVIRLVGHGVAGMWTPEVVHLYVLAIPLVLVAFWVGNRVSHRMSPERYQRIIYGALVVLGVTLILRSLWG
jgi:uncharacterized membrane protein YfcA